MRKSALDKKWWIQKWYHNWSLGKWRFEGSFGLCFRNLGLSLLFSKWRRRMSCNIHFGPFFLLVVSDERGK